MNQIIKRHSAVPETPHENSWTAILRWLICVMNDEDKSMGFVAGCLSQCVKNGGLTDRQADGCRKVFSRILDDYEHLQLDCQNGDSSG